MPKPYVDVYRPRFLDARRAGGGPEHVIHLEDVAALRCQQRGYTRLPPEARENVAAQFRRAVERGEPTDFETVFLDASGHLRGVRAQHFPLRQGKAIVVFSFSRSTCAGCHPGLASSRDRD